MAVPPQFEDFKDTGYDEEERHFKEEERRLLARRRAEMEAARAGDAAAEKPRLCPNCRAQMIEDRLGEEQEAARVDRCDECSGVFINKDALQRILEARKQSGFLASLRGMFR